jgi:hypothetical protein
VVIGGAVVTGTTEGCAVVTGTIRVGCSQCPGTNGVASGAGGVTSFEATGGVSSFGFGFGAGFTFVARFDLFMQK